MFALPLGPCFPCYAMSILTHYQLPPLVNLALSLLVGPSQRRAQTDRLAICIVAVAAVIFRAELVLFLVPLAFINAIKYRSVRALAVAGISSVLSAIG